MNNNPTQLQLQLPAILEIFPYSHPAKERQLDGNTGIMLQDLVGAKEKSTPTKPSDAVIAKIMCLRPEKEKIKKALLACLQSNLTAKEIARRYGTHQSVLCYWSKRVGIPARRRGRPHFLSQTKNHQHILAMVREHGAAEAELFGLDVPNQSWRRQVADADNYWLSPSAIQHCLAAYLSARLGSESDHLLGDKVIKTMRLGQDARVKLLDDFKRMPRSTDQLGREWERWLKGSQPALLATFNQQAAAENSSVIHLSATHPLVRQAARYLQLTDPAFVSLTGVSTLIPPGKYLFALYRWKLHGVKTDEVLVPVASLQAVEDALMEILQTAVDASPSEAPPRDDLDNLDVLHHAKWTVAQANHIAENRQIVEHRIQSLTVSHRARCAAIQAQIDRATNDKIRIMKTGELARANADFAGRQVDLQQAAGSGDIHANAVLFGIIEVKKETRK